MDSNPAELNMPVDSILFVDDGQPLVEVARVVDDGQPLVEVARTVADGGFKGEGMDEWEFAVDGGGRTVGAGQVTEILERSSDGGVGIIDVLEVRLAADDGGFVFGQTMYFE